VLGLWEVHVRLLKYRAVQALDWLDMYVLQHRVNWVCNRLLYSDWWK
jgi:hypothetical protein